MPDAVQASSAQKRRAQGSQAMKLREKRSSRREERSEPTAEMIAPNVATWRSGLPSARREARTYQQVS